MFRFFLEPMFTSLGPERWFWLKIQLRFIRNRSLQFQAALTGRCVGLDGGACGL